MIKLFVALFAIFTLVSSNANALADPPGLGKHGGFVSESSGFKFELVTKRNGENVQFICYVSNGGQGYLTSGALVLLVTCPDGRTLELETTPSSGYFTAFTKIRQRGGFQVQETYHSDVGQIAVTSARKNI